MPGTSDNIYYFAHEAEDRVPKRPPVIFDPRRGRLSFIMAAADAPPDPPVCLCN